MDNTALRESLILQAEKAMLAMLTQVNVMLEAAHLYAARNPPISPTLRMKHKELKQSVFELGSIPRMLVDEINRWKKGENRILGRQGIEANLLGELYANLESLLWFYTRESIDVPGFSLDIVRASHAELLRCNRLL